MSSAGRASACEARSRRLGHPHDAGLPGLPRAADLLQPRRVRRVLAPRRSRATQPWAV